MRSSSVQRVARALVEAGHKGAVQELYVSTKAAAEAANALAIVNDQIAKSIVLQSLEDDRLYLFITSGSRRVDLSRAAQLAGTNLRQASPELIRQRTGFAIGGVAPLGHFEPIPAWVDFHLMGFHSVWGDRSTNWGHAAR